MMEILKIHLLNGKDNLNNISINNSMSCNNKET